MPVRYQGKWDFSGEANLRRRRKRPLYGWSCEVHPVSGRISCAASLGHSGFGVLTTPFIHSESPPSLHRRWGTFSFVQSPRLESAPCEKHPPRPCGPAPFEGGIFATRCVASRETNLLGFTHAVVHNAINVVVQESPFEGGSRGMYLFP